MISPVSPFSSRALPNSLTATIRTRSPGLKSEDNSAIAQAYCIAIELISIRVIPETRSASKPCRVYMKIPALASGNRLCHLMFHRRCPAIAGAALVNSGSGRNEGQLPLRVTRKVDANEVAIRVA